jgi:hypothetical protein
VEVVHRFPLFAQLPFWMILKVKLKKNYFNLKKYNNN